MWTDRLTLKEAQCTERALAALSSSPWARPLITRLEASGGIKSENMPLMFEVRFAQELQRAGVVAEYEFRAGVGDSSVEFRLQTTPPWLIELVSVRTSRCVQACHSTGWPHLRAASPADARRPRQERRGGDDHGRAEDWREGVFGR